MRTLAAAVPLLLFGGLLVAPATPLGGEAVATSADTSLTTHPSAVTDLADQSIVFQADDGDRGEGEGDEEPEEDDDDEGDDDEEPGEDDDGDEEGDDDDESDDEEEPEEEEDDDEETEEEDDEGSEEDDDGDEGPEEDDEESEEGDDEEGENEEGPEQESDEEQEDEESEEDEASDNQAQIAPQQEAQAETTTSTRSPTETSTLTQTATETPTAIDPTETPTATDPTQTPTSTPSEIPEPTAVPTEAEPTETERRSETTDSSTSSASASGPVLETAEGSNTDAPPSDGTRTPESSRTVTVTDVRGLSDWVRAGHDTSVVATVVNRGEAPTRKALTVTVDGDPVTERTVTLQPGERRSVRIQFEATEGTVAVENVKAGRLAVGESYGEERSPAPEADAESTTRTGALLALLAITGVGVALWHTRE